MAKQARTESTKKKMPKPVAQYKPHTIEDSQGGAAGTFPIVGIGASAGGLEALEQFLSSVPEDSGMAFVVVQHLSPTHKGILPELLQRYTAMKVIQVRDGQKIEPDCVYVIPPNKDMSMLHEVLHLMEPTAPRGLRLPIDYFFRSLAEDRQHLSVGVVLSGMGSDGTLGIRAIKEKAGLALVQEPASAQFDGMPRSVIEAGLADYVAQAEELPEKIIGYLKHAHQIVRSEPALEDKTQSALEKVLILLRGRTGQDFSLYKKSTIYRRIERRMGIHQIDKIGDYVRYLQENSQEVDLLYKELLIGVTNFFRDPPAWEQLKAMAIPKLLASRQAGMLRAWTPGCSTGEEAYSLAIVFKEALEQVKPKENFSLQIFATDVDRDAIDKARQGVFLSNISADVSPERLKRFFIKEESGYRVNKDIREMVIFAPQNVIMNPPFTKLDILTCRNLLIYLTAEVQKKLLPLFHFSLNAGGILFLGSAEAIGGFTDLFSPVHDKSRIYTRKEAALLAEPVEFPTFFYPSRRSEPYEPGMQKPVVNLKTLADQLLLQRYSPAAVLVNNKGDILYISGRTGKYLEPAAGKVNWNVFAMAREGLRYEMLGAFKKALRQKNAVTLHSLKVSTDGGPQFVDMTVQAVQDPEELRRMIIFVFTDVAPPPKPKESAHAKSTAAPAIMVAELEKELQLAREEVESTYKEMQTSEEELKSSNEELQSTNEELQSTNEELTTSKEEMQSMNEELQTLNAELHSKVGELSLANNDMKNLLNSTDIATVFLDNDLRVRRFTTQATKIIKLIPGDIGRPFTDLTSVLIYPELTGDAREVLQTLVFKEKQITASDGRWFRMRIMPYRTLDNKIDGVVMTCTDITEAKTLESKLRLAKEDLEQRVAGQQAELKKITG